MTEISHRMRNNILYTHTYFITENDLRINISKKYYKKVTQF